MGRMTFVLKSFLTPQAAPDKESLSLFEPFSPRGLLSSGFFKEKGPCLGSLVPCFFRKSLLLQFQPSFSFYGYALRTSKRFRVAIGCGRPLRFFCIFFFFWDSLRNQTELLLPLRFSPLVTFLPRAYLRFLIEDDAVLVRIYANTF